ncbi:MAG: redoxin domain-containing protein [Planctomycetes bacterium]|nr:redoxin domain-containing protein [Planctomycetota bacterium]
MNDASTALATRIERPVTIVLLPPARRSAAKHALVAPAGRPRQPRLADARFRPIELEREPARRARGDAVDLALAHLHRRRLAVRGAHSGCSRPPGVVRQLPEPTEDLALELRRRRRDVIAVGAWPFAGAVERDAGTGRLPLGEQPAKQHQRRAAQRIPGLDALVVELHHLGVHVDLLPGQRRLDRRAERRAGGIDLLEAHARGHRGAVALLIEDDQARHPPLHLRQPQRQPEPLDLALLDGDVGGEADVLAREPLDLGALLGQQRRPLLPAGVQLEAEPYRETAHSDEADLGHVGQERVRLPHDRHDASLPRRATDRRSDPRRSRRYPGSCHAMVGRARRSGARRAALHRPRWRTAMLKTGDAAPAFRVTGHDGKEVALADLAKDAKKTVVLWFYPKADTPG